MDNKELYTEFMKRYAPDRVAGYSVPPRSYEDIPDINPNEPQMRNIALAVDEQRLKNPHIGMQMAGQEIFNSLTNWLNTAGKGVQAEALMAVSGAMGGLEMQRSILNTAREIGKDGEKNLFGDYIGNEFCSFYMTAAQNPENPYEKLQPLSAYCASNAGTEKYWETPFNKVTGISPKGIIEIFDHKFDKMFATFTRFPNERPMAYAFAAITAIEKVGAVCPKEKALSVLAEYGWRTSHYIC